MTMSAEKKRLTKTEKRVLIIMAVAAIVAAVIFLWLMYVNDYYKATDKAKEALLGSRDVVVEETDDYYLFSIKDEATQGIIFYPGKKVEETAYAPLLLELAKQGYDVYLVKMPARLAIFGMNKAENIMEHAPEIEGWTMMGHSLGGVMAASFSAAHDEKVDRLVLLAAYSTEDLTKLDIDVYSFYGSEDKVLNMEKYKKYYSNLPEDVVETVIDGGNHAYYGNYGNQKNDGTASITRNEQQQSVIDVFFYEITKDLYYDAVN